MGNGPAHAAPADGPGPVLIIGAHSFLANQFRTLSRFRDDLTAISHRQLDQTPLDAYRCIINFALAPDYSREPYRPEIDFDRQIVERMRGAGVHYVLLSSRKVYAGSPGRPLSETSPLGPTCRYGENKLHTETWVWQRAAPNCTILRIGNVFGREPDRRTFMGLAQSRLVREGRIVLDVSPFVERDFLPVDRFCRVLDHVLHSRPTGIFNVGSGLAIPIGRIALWLLEGFQGGELVVNRFDERDGFVLDITKISSRIGPLCTEAMIREYCLELGRRIRREI